MNTSIRELILVNIKETLTEIKTEKGFDNNIASVQRWKQNGNPLKDTPCIIISAGREEKEPSPHPQSTATFSVFVDLWFRQAETDTQDTDAILNSLLMDIEKALAMDITRGGYAVDTNIRSVTPFETVVGQAHCGLMIELEVLYEHAQNNPASLT